MKEKNVFLDYVGNSPFMRILDFLITGREFDYTMTDISKKSGVGWTTFNRIFPKMIENDIVVQVRQVGMAKLYKINLNNPVVQKMVKLYQTILAENLKSIEKKRLIKA
ncbi:MAG TPA: hypothetical protein VJJ23_02910 [Candidatus Nanoarchaeia archaeon]|nr:hypothetical protein [Candidatus Nanoarchaeia archaeon]